MNRITVMQKSVHDASSAHAESANQPVIDTVLSINITIINNERSTCNLHLKRKHVYSTTKYILNTTPT